jgi:hypothetical protein
MTLSSRYRKRKSAHVWRSGAAATPLETLLPQSIGYRLYRHSALQFDFLDVFRRGRAPEHPFSALLPSADLPLELPPELAALDLVYRYLKTIGRANGLKRSYINLCLLLSRALGVRCLSLAADEVDLDFACVAEGGRLTHLSAACSDLTVSFADGQTVIEPSAPPPGDRADISQRELREALPEVRVTARIPWPGDDLHPNVLAEWRRFGSNAPAVIGLGQRDFSFDKRDFEVIAERACS